jgi:hypothetical protein
MMANNFFGFSGIERLMEQEAKKNIVDCHTQDLNK